MSDSAQSPFRVLTYGEEKARLEPGYADKPNDAPYSLDTWNKIVEGDLVRVYNRGVLVFAIGPDGSVTGVGSVPILLYPLERAFFSSDTWTWKHDLPYRPMVEVFGQDRHLMSADVNNATIGTTVVTHTYNVTGYVTLR